jgi:hypothetical protein
VTDTGTCTTVSNCSTIISRNTYVGDPLYSWDLRLSRYFQLSERVRLTLGVDAFNFLNRANVDEVTSVYGSPVFCGATPAIPHHYNDAISRAIQSGAVSCASQQTTAIQAPVTAANPDPTGIAFILAGVLPSLIPNTPNPVFGEPRTAFNPRQFQFSAKFAF